MSTPGACTTISSAFSSAAESPSIGKSTAPRAPSPRSALERASGVARVVGRAQVVVKTLGRILREDVHAQDPIRRLALALEDEARVDVSGPLGEEKVAPALRRLPVSALRVERNDVPHRSEERRVGEE